MWASFDLSTLTGEPSVAAAFAKYAQHAIPFLIYSIDTDCCFTPRVISQFHRRLLMAGVSSRYLRIHSLKGHDSFLLEPELYASGIRSVLGALSS